MNEVNSLAKHPQAENPTGHPRGEQRINELLDVAAEVFLEFGYEATSMGTIAKRAKASKETFYARYPNKEELFKAVVFRKAEVINDRFRNVLGKDKPLRQTLASFGEELLGLLLEPDSIARLRIVSMEARRFPVVGAEFYRSGPEQVNLLLAHYLEQRQRAGELRTKMDACLAAEQFIEMATTSLVRKTMLGVIVDASPAERKKRVRSAVDVFLDGYRNRSENPV